MRTTQRLSHSLEDLARISPADGVVCGLGTINAPLFGEAIRRIADEASVSSLFD